MTGNIVIGGMTGGPGNIGLVGEGYGGASYSPPPVHVSSGLSPLLARPTPLSRIPFIKRFITIIQIRRPLTQEGRINGKIRRPFSESVVFTSTTVKHLEEEISIGGFIMRVRKSKAR